jgi:integrase
MARNAPPRRSARRQAWGRVRQLASGRWQARAPDPERPGRLVAAPTTFAAKPDAERWLAAARTDQERGRWLDPGAGQVTVERYATAWLAGRSDLRPSTSAKYAGLLRRHVVPALGATELARLTPSAVRAWYHELARSHPSTAADAYRFLRAVLASAVADERIGRNPCQVKGAGNVRAPERPVASVAEVQAAIAAAPERWRTALELAAWCQLRRGELLGLRRADVDLEQATVSVERAWVQTADGELVLGEPKTRAGRRSVAVPANVLPALDAHLERFVGRDPGAWLFPGEGGEPVSPRTMSRVWQEARQAIERPDLRLHDLRHSGLTWAAATGATTAELMRRGGHASPQAALRYQHATEDRDRALAEALAGLAPGAGVVPIAPARDARARAHPAGEQLSERRSGAVRSPRRRARGARMGHGEGGTAGEGAATGA